MLETKNLLFIILSLFLFSCNLEKEIEIELPAYEVQPVVECYLEAGQFYTLLLTKSAAYFDAFPDLNSDFTNDLLEEEATVTITYKGEVIELQNNIGLNPFTNKIFNYVAAQEIPADYDTDFELNITTKSGQTMSAVTRLLSPVSIDSVVVEYSETNDTLARVLTYFTDNLDTENFYRRMLHLNSLDSLEVEFVTGDGFLDNSTVVFGTNYSYTPNDTLITSVFHIDKPYYDFLLSIGTAVSSNGNPFGQPSSIISNIKGDGIGIFTGVAFDRKQVIVE